METRIVFKYSLARLLVRKSYRIVDLKPQRNKDGTLDFTRCLFVFAYEDGIDEIIERETNKK